MAYYSVISSAHINPTQCDKYISHFRMAEEKVHTDSSRSLGTGLCSLSKPRIARQEGGHPPLKEFIPCETIKLNRPRCRCSLRPIYPPKLSK